MGNKDGRLGEADRATLCMGVWCSSRSQGQVSWKTSARANDNACKWWLSRQRSMWHAGRLCLGASPAEYFPYHTSTPARATSEPQFHPQLVIRRETPHIVQVLLVAMTPCCPQDLDCHLNSWEVTLCSYSVLSSSSSLAPKLKIIICKAQ